MSDIINKIPKIILDKRAEALKNSVPILREKSFSYLLNLAYSMQPKRILEIGSAVGTTSAALLSVTKYAVLTGIEYEYERIAEAKNTLKGLNLDRRANFLEGDAGEIIPMLTGTYDLIFLDGPKGHYFEYLPYLKALLNKGGYLVADNVLFRGLIEGTTKIPHPQKMNTIVFSLRNFIESVTNDSDFQTTLIKEEDGMTVSKKLN